MTDDLNAYLTPRSPSAERPLMGLTILVVEDSRFACEAFRLMGQRLGARIRRADCLRSARRHLQTYRPGVVIIDVGLPDGVGTDLIAELAAAPVRVPAILGTSGDAEGRAAALAAGADDFIDKPVESLARFRGTILAALPGLAPKHPVAVPINDTVVPDTLALRDDLSEAARLLADSGLDAAKLGYISQFLSGVAREAQDAPLAAACADIARAQRLGLMTEDDRARLRGLVGERLRSAASF